MKFDMGAAWNEAVAMISANREVLAIVAGIFFFLPTLLVTMLGPDMSAMFAMGSDPEQIEQMSEQVLAAYGDIWWLYALATVAQILGYISLLTLLRDEGRPTVGEAISMGVKGLLPSIGAYLLASFGIALLFVAIVALAALTGIEALAAVAVLVGLVVMVYVMIKFSLSAPVIAIEKVSNPVAVLRRSWTLTKGNSFRLLGFFGLIFIAYFVISMIAGLITAGVMATVGGEVGKFLQGVLGGLLGMVATIVIVAVLAAAHRQLAGPSAGAAGRIFD